MFLTRSTLFNYISTRPELDTLPAELFGMVSSGRLKVEIRQRFALKDAVEAHRQLEARKTSGSTVLTV